MTKNEFKSVTFLRAKHMIDQSNELLWLVTKKYIELYFSLTNENENDKIIIREMFKKKQVELNVN